MSSSTQSDKSQLVYKPGRSLRSALLKEFHRQIQQTNEFVTSTTDMIIGTVAERHLDVILITGGCSGLGLEIVKEFTRRDYPKIVVFDIKIPDSDDDSSYIPGVHYYQCDVSNFERIQELQGAVRRDVGIVTILINNAGITIAKPFLEMTVPEINKVVSVNLLSNFYMNKAFLPDMVDMKRGYIITVASVLGYMSPSSLSAYGASKSGTIALHESLTYELGGPLNLNPETYSGVKTLLVCPGQLQTPMFAGVHTPSSILAPVLEPSWVAQKLVKSIERGARGEIRFPIYGNFLPLFRATPWLFTQLARLMSGMDESMQNWGNPNVNPKDKVFPRA
ncbi:hypothetical protein WICPIJ_005966 [Wickerhamomyces pijperi]|uniref:Uncharacterized protein n=1 Tax=Wickerhamomyces pijperi TaxID=599730 RepID=A0A9P8Q2M2_WICPI|nr:hypothetical protein WICPIJ_005966 [Wickerhamomyces pijperi]